MLNRQGAQEGLIDERKNCHVRPNAKGEGQYGNNCEARIAAQLAQAEAEVLREVVPPEPTARFVEALLGPRDVAEGAPRRHASLFFAQALLLQLLRFEREMCFDLRSEIARLASSPEHRLNPPRLWHRHSCLCATHPADPP